MTSQGSPYGRFTKALRSRNLFHAELAARELGRLNLNDALELTLLIREEDASRYERAALRWHARFELETKGLTLAESQLVLAALNRIATSAPEDAARAVAVLRHRPST